MNFGIAIIGIVLIIIGGIPIFLVNNNSKKKEKQSLKILNDLATNYKCTITQFDILNKKIIGIDKVNFWVFFVKSIDDHHIQQAVNLADVKKCQLVNSGSTFKSSEGSYKVTNKVELTFHLFEQAKIKTVFEWYNAETDNFMITGELQLAENWEKIINETLKDKTPKSIPTAKKLVHMAGE